MNGKLNITKARAWCRWNTNKQIFISISIINTECTSKNIMKVSSNENLLCERNRQINCINWSWNFINIYVRQLILIYHNI